MKTYWVYIMSSVSRVLYVGITNSIERRVAEHKAKQVAGFSARYNTYALVHFEAYGNARAAIARERQIKGWLRVKKVTLIKSSNPQWNDLSAIWFSPTKKTANPPRVSS